MNKVQKQLNPSVNFLVPLHHTLESNLTGVMRLLLAAAYKAHDTGIKGCLEVRGLVCTAQT